MPQYHFDRNLDMDTWNGLDAFTQGYIEAAFWTGNDEEGIPDMGLHDLARNALASMVADCKAFQELARDDLDKAYSHAPAHYDANMAGVDFWLTRNGHGAGFWDRGLGQSGGRLSDAATFGTCDLYLGDDNMVHVT